MCEVEAYCLFYELLTLFTACFSYQNEIGVIKDNQKKKGENIGMEKVAGVFVQRTRATYMR